MTAGVLAAMCDDTSVAAENILAGGTKRTLKLSTGRCVEYWEYGKGDIPCLFIHGLTGSGKQFAGVNYEELGMRVIAPNMYGKGTDWQKRTCVMDAGEDLAALVEALFGKGVLPIILGVSAGGKDAYAAGIVLNAKHKDHQVPGMYLISVQPDTSDPEVWDHLTGEQQRAMRLILGISREARGPILQLFRNTGARVKEVAAERKVRRMAGSPEVTDALSWSADDVRVLLQNPEIAAILASDTLLYSGNALIDSIEKMDGWGYKLNQLGKETPVFVIQGGKDRIVHPGSAKTIATELEEADIPHTVQIYSDDGHTLALKRQLQIAQDMCKRHKK